MSNFSWNKSNNAEGGRRRRRRRFRRKRASSAPNFRPSLERSNTLFPENAWHYLYHLGIKPRILKATYGNNWKETISNTLLNKMDLGRRGIHIMEPGSLHEPTYASLPQEAWDYLRDLGLKAGVVRDTFGPNWREIVADELWHKLGLAGTSSESTCKPFSIPTSWQTNKYGGPPHTARGKCAWRHWEDLGWTEQDLIDYYGSGWREVLMAKAGYKVPPKWSYRSTTRRPASLNDDEFIERREKIIKQFGPKFDNNPHYLLFKFGFPPTTTTLSWEEYSKALPANSKISKNDWQFLYALGWKLEDLDRMIGPNWQNLFLNKPEKKPSSRTRAPRIYPSTMYPMPPSAPTTVTYPSTLDLIHPATRRMAETTSQSSGMPFITPEKAYLFALLILFLFFAIKRFFWRR